MAIRWKKPCGEAKYFWSKLVKMPFWNHWYRNFFPRMNLFSCVLHKHIKDSKLIKSGNAHCYNCAVIGPQIRHKNKRNLSEFPKNGCIHDTLKTGRKARTLLIFLSTVHMYVLIIWQKFWDCTFNPFCVTIFHMLGPIAYFSFFCHFW